MAVHFEAMMWALLRLQFSNGWGDGKYLGYRTKHLHDCCYASYGTVYSAYQPA